MLMLYPKGKFITIDWVIKKKKIIINEPNSMNSFEVRSHSNIEESEADDRIDEILYGNPWWTLRKTLGLFIKLIWGLVIIGITSVLMWIFNTDQPIARRTVMFITMNGWVAPFILVFINIIITLFFIPGVFGALLWGYSYWFITTNILLVMMAGTTTWFIGFSLGSIMAMYIGRYLAKSWIQKLHDKSKYLRALSCWFERKGFKIMFLLRLSPLVPYNVLNYIMGVYPISLYQFQLSNFGMLPGIIVYVYVGTAVSSLGALFQTDNGGAIIRMIMFCGGLVIAAVAVVVIIIYTKKELNKALLEKEQKNIEENGRSDEELKINSLNEEIQMIENNSSILHVNKILENDHSVTRHFTIKNRSTELNLKDEENGDDMLDKNDLKIDCFSKSMLDAHFEIDKFSCLPETRPRNCSIVLLNNK